MSGIRARPGPRAGFTLIELLVVIGLLALVFGLGVAFLPAVNQKREAAYGAEILQNALATARQRAKRDNLVTGVRIIFDTDPNRDSPGHRTRLQFVQQPPDYTAGVITRVSTSGLNAVVTLGPDPANPALAPNLLPIADQFSRAAAAGGSPPPIFLEINGSGVPHQVVNAGGATLTLTWRLPYDIGVPPSPPAALPYRIFRAPLPIVGEQPIDLPRHIRIKKEFSSTNGMTPAPLATEPDLALNSPSTRIMFSPEGGLALTERRLLAEGRIILFVCDERVTGTNLGTATAGSPTLVCIVVRTGHIAAHPVDITPGGNPYSFCNNPRSSGM